MPNRIPRYFYDINAVLPDGRQRWCDDPSSPKDRERRDASYEIWRRNFRDRLGNSILQPKLMKWQVIQIVSRDHSENNPRDWWPEFQDCLFRVFMQPETFYEGPSHEQWYILSPEDAYLVLRYKAEKDGPDLPPRNYEGNERYLSANRELRTALLVPVECCRHWKHETSGGELPLGL